MGGEEQDDDDEKVVWLCGSHRQSARLTSSSSASLDNNNNNDGLVINGQTDIQFQDDWDNWTDYFALPSNGNFNVRIYGRPECCGLMVWVGGGLGRVKLYIFIICD